MLLAPEWLHLPFGLHVWLEPVNGVPAYFYRQPDSDHACYLILNHAEKLNRMPLMKLSKIVRLSAADIEAVGTAAMLLQDAAQPQPRPVLCFRIQI